MNVRGISVALLSLVCCHCDPKHVKLYPVLDVTVFQGESFDSPLLTPLCLPPVSIHLKPSLHPYRLSSWHFK